MPLSYLYQCYLIFRYINSAFKKGTVIPSMDKIIKCTSNRMEKNKISTIPTETSKPQSENGKGEAVAEFNGDQNSLDEREHAAKGMLQQNI